MVSTRSLTRFTGIGRPVDLREPSNRFAVLAFVLFGVGGFVAVLLLDDIGWVSAAGRGGAYGVAAFLTWAIGREVDPDHPRSARYGTFAYVPLAFLGAPAIAALFATLLAARVVVRTSGRAPRLLDLVVLTGVAAAAGAGSASGLAAGLVLAIAIWLDTRPPDAADSGHTIAAAAAATAAVVGALAADRLAPGWTQPTVWEWVAAGAVAVAAALLRTPRVDTMADSGDAPILPVRLVRGRVLVLLTVALALAYAGGPTVATLGAVVAAAVGAAVTSIQVTRAPRP